MFNVIHSILALILLLVATVLAVYKPMGLTSYGRRLLSAQRRATGPVAAPTSLTVNTRRFYVWAILAAGIILLFVMMHLAGGDFGHH